MFSFCPCKIRFRKYFKTFLENTMAAGYSKWSKQNIFDIRGYCKDDEPQLRFAFDNSNIYKF